MKNKKEITMSFLELKKLIKGSQLELLLSFSFMYSVLMTSWCLSVSIFFLYIDLMPRYIADNSILFGAIVIGLGFGSFYLNKQRITRGKSYWSDLGLMNILETCVKSVVYLVSSAISLILVIFCFVFDGGINLVGAIIICSFIFYLLTHFSFYICENQNFDLHKKTSTFVLKNHIKKELFLFIFIAAYLTLNNLDVFGQFLFDHTELLWRDISKIKRGWELIISSQFCGNIFVILLIIIGAINAKYQIHLSRQD